MSRSPGRAALPLSLFLLAAPLQAQLPLLTAPSGTLRIELGGAFFPTDRQYADGAQRELGSPLQTSSLGAGEASLVADLEARLAALLGRPAAGQSLGGLHAIVEQQRGVGTIGLGWGITRRLTLAARIPIVSVRTQTQLNHDAAGATLGLNPADPFLGGSGAQQNEVYFAQFGSALNELATRTASGAYDSDPALRALAEQTLADAPGFRDGLAALLATAPVLPALGTPDGDALLAASTTYRDRLSETFGIAGFTTNPALPAAPLEGDAFGELLTSPSGFALLPFGEDPRVGIGDIDVSLTGEVLRRGAPGDARWFGVWVHAGATLPTGTPPRAAALYDQGTGDGQLDLSGGVTVEAGRRAFGLRVAGGYRHQLAGALDARIGARDAALRGASQQALLTRDPGDVLYLDVQPFVRLAPRLAIVGTVRWWSRGDDRWDWAASQQPLDGLDPFVMNAGTGANAVLTGVGLSYVHDGTHRDAVGRMPVEAAFGIERVVRSGRGVVDAPLSARVTFRVYKRLTGRPPPP